MANKPEITKEEAQKWVDSRAWAGDLKLVADKTIDPVEFYQQYHMNKELWDKLFDYLSKTDVTKLEKGKYVLVPDLLWVSILEYTPKDKANTKIENHNEYIDLQWTFDGDEIYGLANGKVEPVAPYDEVKDKRNWTTTDPIDYVPAPLDTFFLYFPKDMHQPSVAAHDEPVPARKVVGKIKYAK